MRSCFRPWHPTLAGASLLAATACAAPDTTSGDGIPTEVILLEGGFVRFDGRRVPTEAFLVEMRQRVRAAGGDTSRYPSIRVLIPSELPGDRLDSLLRELQSAGIRQVTLG